MGGGESGTPLKRDRTSDVHSEPSRGIECQGARQLTDESTSSENCTTDLHLLRFPSLSSTNVALSCHLSAEFATITDLTGRPTSELMSRIFYHFDTHQSKVDPSMIDFRTFRRRRATAATWQCGCPRRSCPTCRRRPGCTAWPRCPRQRRSVRSTVTGRWRRSRRRMRRMGIRWETKIPNLPIYWDTKPQEAARKELSSK